MTRCAALTRPRLPYPRRMADGEKPYRVYKGGGRRAKVPDRRRARSGEQQGRRAVRANAAGAGRAGGRARRASALGCSSSFVLLVVWIVASYLSFRGGVEDANARLPEGRRGAASRRRTARSSRSRR